MYDLAYLMEFPNLNSNSKVYSDLELLVQEDMKKKGLNYPFISVEQVKDYWKSLLQ